MSENEPLPAPQRDSARDNTGETILTSARDPTPARPACTRTRAQTRAQARQTGERSYANIGQLDCCAYLIYSVQIRDVGRFLAKFNPWTNTFGNRLVRLHCSRIQPSVKVSNGAKIRNRYNQVPHLTQDTNGKVTNSQKTPQTRAKRSALSQQVTTKHI